MTPVFEFRRRKADLIFDLEDRFARERGSEGPHPRPSGPFRFFVVARIVNGARQPLDRPLELAVIRNNSGYYLFFGEERLGPGSTRSADLTQGSYVVRVESPLYQAVEVTDVVIETLFQPRGPQPGLRAPYFADLTPGYAYPFPGSSTLGGGRGPTLLRGSVLAPGGAGIDGVEVEVPGRSTVYRTSANGQWVLVFPDTQPSGDVTVQFRFPGNVVRNIAQAGVRQGEEASLPQAALRGYVLLNGAGVEGAAIRVSGKPEQAVTASDGGWFYYFDLDQQDEMVAVSARLPDGRNQTQNNIPVRRRATSVVPSFRFV